MKYTESETVELKSTFIPEIKKEIVAAIIKMIKETDGDVFEDIRSVEQTLTFECADEEFKRRNVEFGTAQKKTLGIINADNEYTNLGLLISDQCPHIIKVAAFKGTTQAEFQDRKEFGGSLLKQLADCYSYLDMWNYNAGKIEGLYRLDNRSYPVEALREALLNAIVHRDYSMSAPVLVSIYDDRIEIVSVGGLCKGLALEDVLMGLSVCRNPKLANIFYRLNLIEAYGTGLKKIIDSYEKYPCSAEFFATANAFKVVLQNTNVESEKDICAKNQTESELIEFIKSRGKASRVEIEGALSLSSSTTIRILNRLKAQGIIKADGTGKNTKYMIS